jgi:hypothetical protein
MFRAIQSFIVKVSRSSEQIGIRLEQILSAVLVEREGISLQKMSVKQEFAAISLSTGC